MPRIALITYACSALLGTLITRTAFADAAAEPSEALQEIIVTAEKQTKICRRRPRP